MTNKTVVLTEAKAITLAKRNKLEVKAIETATYKRSKTIASGNPLNSFIKTLEQLFETVELATDENGNVLRGKNRMYVCTNRLRTTAKREDKRKAQFSSAEDSFKKSALVILTHKQAVENTASYTIKHWGKEVFSGKINVNTERFKENLLNSLPYQDDEAFDKLFNIKGIVGDLAGRHTDALRNLVTKTFTTLENEGKVKLTNDYKAVTMDEKGNTTVFPIDEATHNNVSKVRHDMIIEAFGSKVSYAKVYSSEDKKDIKIAQDFNKSLINLCGFFYSYRNIAVEVIKPKPITKAQLKKANGTAKKAIQDNFLEKIDHNRNVESVMEKWNGKGHNPMGFVTNVFSPQLAKLFTTNRKIKVEFDEKLMATYVDTFNKNLELELTLTIKSTKSIDVTEVEF